MRVHFFLYMPQKDQRFSFLSRLLDNATSNRLDTILKDKKKHSWTTKLNEIKCKTRKKLSNQFNTFITLNSLAEDNNPAPYALSSSLSSFHSPNSTVNE